MKLRKMQVVLLIIAGVAVTGVAGVFLLSLTAARPDNLGVHEGRLAETPQSPNCVSTQAEDQSHWIAPLTFEGDPSVAMNSLHTIISELPRSTIVQQTDEYLHAEIRSAFFRFPDDLEFLADPETGRIDFRSASRVGYSDMGVNRKRMEEIRRLFGQRTGTPQQPEAEGHRTAPAGSELPR